jgi:uncharacterized protein
MRLRLPVVLGLLLAAAVIAAAALPIPPAPDRRINDYAGALSAGERARLEDKLRAREQSSSNQVVVAIFRSLQGESLEDYSIRLAQAWRIGQKGLDNGVIFLIFLDDRKMRLEVGYGLEAKLTDALSSQILRQSVAPPFREGKVGDGIAAGLDAIDQAIAGTYAGAAPARRQQGPGLFTIALAVIVLAGLGAVILPAVFASHARRQGWTGGSRGWGGPGGSVFLPGGGGGGSGGGGGGGDFSGGGGGFGGGGASGDW